ALAEARKACGAPIAGCLLNTGVQRCTVAINLSDVLEFAQRVERAPILHVVDFNRLLLQSRHECSSRDTILGNALDVEHSVISLKLKHNTILASFIHAFNSAEGFERVFERCRRNGSKK